MNSAIKDQAQLNETLKSHDIPDGLWKTVGADLFAIHGRDYLKLVDYYSVFIDRGRTNGRDNIKGNHCQAARDSNLQN